MDFIEACRQAIGFDTSPSGGTREFANWLAELARSFDLEVEVIEESFHGHNQANILISPKGAKEKKSFLLQTHLDTVEPGSLSFWTRVHLSPFSATIKDGKIYGLGAASGKLDFLCKLFALKEFAKINSWKMPPQLVGTYGEEIGMHGMLRLIRRNKISAQYAMIGEPSDLQITYAAKGYAVVEIVVPFSEEEQNYRIDHDLRESTSTQTRLFVGKASHSSNPETGESAIVKMVDYLMQLPDGVALMQLDGGVAFNVVPSDVVIEIDMVGRLRAPIVSKLKVVFKSILQLSNQLREYNDPDFDPPYPTLNIGVVRTLRDSILIQGSCRIPPIITDDTYSKWISDLEITCQGVGAQCKVTDYKRPYKTNQNSELVHGVADILKELGREPHMVTQSNTNEAALLSRIGVECISIGPGARAGNVHTPEESVAVLDLEMSRQLYKKAIERFCL